MNRRLLPWLCLGLILGGIGCQPNREKETNNHSGFLENEQQFRDKLAELKMQRRLIDTRIQQTEKRKKKTLDHLRSKGVRSSADITDDPDVKYALQNLRAYKAEIAGYQENLAQYDEAIAGIRSMLEAFERKSFQDEVKLTEESFTELRTIVADLNDQLGITDDDALLRDEELAELLDEEMEADQKKSADKRDDSLDDLLK